MEPVQDTYRLALYTRGEMRVTHRLLDPRVTQQFLDRLQRHTRRDQPRGERVSENVPAERLDSRALRRTSQPNIHLLKRPTRPRRFAKHQVSVARGLRLRIREEARERIVQVDLSRLVVLRQADQTSIHGPCQYGPAA